MSLPIPIGGPNGHAANATSSASSTGGGVPTPGGLGAVGSLLAGGLMPSSYVAHSPLFAPMGTPKQRGSVLGHLSPLMLTHGGLFAQPPASVHLPTAAPPAATGTATPTATATAAAALAAQAPRNVGHGRAASITAATAASAATAAVGASSGVVAPAPSSSLSSDSAIRKTKICCTLGPATASVEALVALLHAGMNVARFNCSHGSHASHLEMLQRLKQAILQSGQGCAFLLDTKGPEIRTGLLKAAPLELMIGQELLLRTDLTPEEHNGTYLGDAVEGVSVDYPRLGSVLSVGSMLKIDDGLIVTRVIECLDGSEAEAGGIKGVRVRVENHAFLGNRKGVNLPNTRVDLPAVTDQDKKDLRFAVENGFHFIAASFTRHAAGVQEVRDVLAERPHLGGRFIQVISKIENQEGLDNFDSILQASDGIMVARGDLGVEIPIQKVSTAQKSMIRKCNCVGKPVITATQMLESMIGNPRPTRAEATDVANAVFDGSDCVMLSGETAKGGYGVEAVQVMSAICVSSERAMDYQALFSTIVEATRCTVAAVGASLDKKKEAVTMSAVRVAQDLGARAIIVYSESAASARLVAKYRPAAPIILLTPSATTHRQARLLRGVWSLKVDEHDAASLVATALTFAKSKAWLQEGQSQIVILVSGNQVGVAGAPWTMRILDV